METKDNVRKHSLIHVNIYNTYVICVTVVVFVTIASESHPASIASADNGSMDSLRARTQVKKGAVLLPPTERLSAIASSRLFFRI